MRASEAALRIKQLAANRFSGAPALGAVLVRWAAKLKAEADVPLLISHFERLAVAAAVVGSLRRAAGSLKGRR